ncbi:unnamed protein product [Moneuplotes crassus]|uniref:Methyltransferase type 11 domain-containing protein n=1 Tax=Euplotes crassus TaxID=5936 RepID=A0AAD1XFB8_EUPCR|nr:unnamed protein product [Moneuplotes crassus]
MSFLSGKLSSLVKQTRAKSLLQCSKRSMCNAEIPKVFNRDLHKKYKQNCDGIESPSTYQRLYDFGMLDLAGRLKGMKRNATFENIAFVGRNPHIFIRHLEKDDLIRNLYICDTTEESVDRSFTKINEMINEGFFEKSKIHQPANIEGKVIDEENSWGFEPESLCLIINNMTLHWVNDIKKAFDNFHTSLKPNGAYLGTLFGGDTLQELRISFNLAEGEREGGYGTTVSPMMSLTDIGNSFSYVGFNLPTIDRSQTLAEFPTMFHLIDYLRSNGDQNCDMVRRQAKSPESFLAAASIYQTLFNKLTIPTDQETMMFDECLNDLDFLRQDGDDFGRIPYNKIREKYNFPENLNILSTFEIIYLVGWKYHKDQQKAKSPKMSHMSFRDIVDEIEMKEEGAYVKYGTLTEEMTNEEIDKVAKVLKNLPKK